jgi:hypothetical protein
LTEVSHIHRLDEGARVAGVNVDSIEKTKEELGAEVFMLCADSANVATQTELGQTC